MNQYIKFIMGLIVCLGMAVSVMADATVEIGAVSGYTGNLTKDSSDLEDSYTTITETINYYPIAMLDIRLEGNYTYYGNTVNLSNFVGTGGFTLIPTASDAHTTVYVSGDFTLTKYREAYSGFDNHTYEVVLGTETAIMPGVHHRLGGKFKTSSYLDTRTFDQENYEIFTGWNAVVLENNSLDLEAGFGVATYNSIRDDIFDVLPNIGEDKPDDSIYIERNLYSFYLSPRFSRPIGAKTGINLTYTHRRFTDDDRGIVFGSSNENLSPWSTLWDGENASASVKTFLIPRIIATTGIGYWEKHFLKTLEKDQYFPNLAEARTDFQSRFFLKLQWPNILRGGLFIEPSLYFEYTDNNSTKELYDFTDASISLALTIRP